MQLLLRQFFVECKVATWQPSTHFYLAFSLTAVTNVSFGVWNVKLYVNIDYNHSYKFGMKYCLSITDVALV